MDIDDLNFTLEKKKFVCSVDNVFVEIDENFFEYYKTLQEMMEMNLSIFPVPFDSKTINLLLQVSLMMKQESRTSPQEVEKQVQENLNKARIKDTTLDFEIKNSNITEQNPESTEQKKPKITEFIKTLTLSQLSDLIQVCDFLNFEELLGICCEEYSSRILNLSTELICSELKLKPIPENILQHRISEISWLKIL